mmetsp:Transcript_23014/g.32422  ORF Transcript_23014/g.32422 Transcript_23014/m.32422 type:complete len:230 (-) Transcript_23014:1555-2244(-)
MTLFSFSCFSYKSKFFSQVSSLAFNESLSAITLLRRVLATLSSSRLRAESSFKSLHIIENLDNLRCMSFCQRADSLVICSICLLWRAMTSTNLRELSARAIDSLSLFGSTSPFNFFLLLEFVDVRPLVKDAVDELFVNVHFSSFLFLQSMHTNSFCIDLARKYSISACSLMIKSSISLNASFCMRIWCDTFKLASESLNLSGLPGPSLSEPVSFPFMANCFFRVGESTD